MEELRLLEHCLVLQEAVIAELPISSAAPKYSIRIARIILKATTTSSDGGGIFLGQQFDHHPLPASPSPVVHLCSEQL